MPWESEISDALKVRISTDSGSQLAAANEMWREVPFSYYYGNNDNTIDVVVADVIAAMISPATLPNEVWQKLEGLIGPSTLVKKGIKIMWLATFRAQ